MEGEEGPAWAAGKAGAIGGGAVMMNNAVCEDSESRGGSGKGAGPDYLRVVVEP